MSDGSAIPEDFIVNVVVARANGTVIYNNPITLNADTNTFHC